jgi:hypothetical protein
MRITIITLFLTCLFACKKDTSTSITDLLGNYSVTEDARLFGSSTILQSTTFDASVDAGATADVVLFNQSARVPRPVWVGLYTDKMELALRANTDSLYSPVGGLLNGLIQADQKVKIHYSYGIGSGTYSVDQIWTKK